MDPPKRHPLRLQRKKHWVARTGRAHAEGNFLAVDVTARDIANSKKCAQHTSAPREFQGRTIVAGVCGRVEAKSSPVVTREMASYWKGEVSVQMQMGSVRWELL